LVIHNGPSAAGAGPTAANGVLSLRNKPFVQDAPEWHAPWKISKVIAGHLGWVRCLSIDPSNEWFVTGSADRMIKIWDLASGQLKLSLTGHISAVRGVLVSPRHPYLFSVGEDKLVKCTHFSCPFCIFYFGLILNARPFSQAGISSTTR
jgi:pleiotropic regulator 1